MDGLLSQEEINALFNTTDDDTETASSADYSSLLSLEESDAIGEISNISMGTAATTSLYRFDIKRGWTEAISLS